MDEETGLYYYGARYYDPRTSVWVSADPILAKYMSGKSIGKQYESSKYFLLNGMWSERQISIQENITYNFRSTKHDELAKLYKSSLKYNSKIYKYIQEKQTGGVYNPKNLSLFSYSMNNPVNYIDPNGEIVMFAPLVWEGLVVLGAALGITVAVKGPPPSFSLPDIMRAEEHTSGKRKSTQEKHQKGQKRLEQKNTDKKRTKDKKWKPRK